MLTVLLLMIIRLIPFEASVFLCNAALGVFFLFSPQSKRQLVRAKETLGKNRFPSSLYVNKLAFNVAVMIRLGSSFTRRLARNAVLKGEEHLKSIQQRHGTAVVATFHYGPWELIAEVFNSRGYNLAALVTKRGGRLLDRFFVTTRRRAGLKTVHNFKQALELTRKGFFLASLFDRTIRAKGDRMNLPYPDYQTSRLPLILAARLRSPIIPVMCRFKSRRLEIKAGSPTLDTEELRRFFTPFFSETPYDWLVWGD